MSRTAPPLPLEALDAPRSALRLLADPTFGPFFAGKLLSTAGVWVHNIAAAIVVYQLTRSALLVGAVSVAQFAPQLVLTPVSGAMADRGDRRRQLIAGRLVAALGSGGLVAHIALVGLEGNAGALAVITAALVVGVGFALGGPAMQALIPSLVRPSELAQAIALNSAPFTLARAGGPALGALLVTTAGPAAAFAVACAGNIVFAVILRVIRIPEVERLVPADSSVRAGFRHIRGDAVLLTLLLGSAAVGIGADPVITLTPPVADALGGGEALVGALASAFGIGAALALVPLGRIRGRLGLAPLGPAGLCLMAAGLGGLAVAPIPAAALAAMVVAGAGMTFGVTALSTQVQQRAPEELRGRIMSVWMLGFLGSRPIAATLNGSVADAAGPPAALAIVVAVLLLAAWAIRPTRVQDDLRGSAS